MRKIFAASSRTRAQGGLRRFDLQLFGGNKLAELRQTRSKLVEEARGLITKAQGENRSLSGDEETRFNELHAQAEGVTKDIEREERQQALEDQAFRSGNPGGGNPGGGNPGGGANDGEFRSLGEMVREVVTNPGSDRLRALTTQDGATGGFLIPAEFQTSILSVQGSGALIRPRATVIPAGSVSPDAGMTQPIFDQSVNSYGGVQIAWLEETAEIIETGFKFEQMGLQPRSLAAIVYVSNKLLRNLEGLTAYVQQRLREAISATEDNVFLAGDGVGKPLGFLNSKAVIDIKRATAGAVGYDDLVDMYGSAKRGGSGGLAWFIAQTSLPAIMKLKTTTGEPLWVPSARDGVPATLLGMPVLESERAPLLGSRGDLVLANLSYYMIKDGSMTVSVSEHTKFSTDMTAIKVVWNVDGQPWVKRPIKLENGGQVSPFVVLK